MWFVIGVAVGYLIDHVFKWMDKQINIRARKALDDEFVETELAYRPMGKPITFSEWEKKFVKNKNG